MPALRERAAALGCDGLVLNGSAPNVQSLAVVTGRAGPTLGTATTQGYVSAICVVAATATVPPDDDTPPPPR